MRILFIGDVVGEMGRNIIDEQLPKLKKEYRPQLTIVNGENAAHGHGITEKIYKQLLNAGADVITLGNHAFDNRQIFEFIGDAKKLVRPANYPVSEGQGMVMVQVNQHKVAVINLQGRTFMPAIDDPFKVADELVDVAREETPFIFVDFHAETTSEKQAMGYFLDGRISALCGTHTHVQTNDARLLNNGTAYLTDVGMTGPVDSILGMKKEAVIEKFRTAVPHRFEVMDEGQGIINFTYMDLDDKTGQAKKIVVDHWYC